MKTILNRYADYAYALLRIVAGFLFACHGAQKLFGALGAEPQLNAMGLIAGSIEFFGGLLIAVGLVATVGLVVIGVGGIVGSRTGYIGPLAINVPAGALSGIVALARASVIAVGAGVPGAGGLTA